MAPGRIGRFQTLALCRRLPGFAGVCCLPHRPRDRRGWCRHRGRAGLPVYAAANTVRESRTCDPCSAQGVPPRASGQQARGTRARGTMLGLGHGSVEIVGVAALVGAERTAAKARASRANGRLGAYVPSPSIGRNHTRPARAWSGISRTISTWPGRLQPHSRAEPSCQIPGCRECSAAAPPC